MTTLTFFGHSAILVESGPTRVVVDPFLSDNPAATISPDEVKCSHVALTHGHEDHVGDTIAIAKANNAQLVASYELCNWAAEQGHDNASPGNPGGRVSIGGDDWIAFTKAFHSSSYMGQYMGMPCGLILHVGGRTVYHAGDTDIFGDMAHIGSFYKPDVALLPIGDRFTMGPVLASQAADLIGAPTVVPIHHGTWPPIEVDVSAFKPASAQVKMLAVNESMTV